MAYLMSIDVKTSASQIILLKKSDLAFPLIT